MKSPTIFQKLFPFLIFSIVLGVVFITNPEAEASSMLPDTNELQASSQQSPLPTPIPTDEPTSVPTDEPTTEPTDVPSSPTSTPLPSDRNVSLLFEGPSSVKPGENFTVKVIVQNVSDPGLYGVQFEINYDPSKVLVNNLALNSNLSFVVRDNIDNTTGNMLVVASKYGRVAGLTGDVILLTFNATAIGDSGFAAFNIENAKFSDSQAVAFNVAVSDYKITIDPEPTPQPTTVPTDEPTPKPTEPTVEPTVEPTSEPTTEPTVEPTVEPTIEPTVEPTPKPTSSPTPEPGMAAVSGQIILTGRSDNNWSGATANINSVEQTALTGATGSFEIDNVATGLHTVSADAPGYLSAVCSEATVTAPQTVLAPVTLLAGDINDDDLVDIADATIIGTSFGQTGPNIPADITQDEIVDIFDIVLGSVNYGEKGPQAWNCTGPNGSPTR
jgi:outer membrane biosynthesis protein TonB